MRVARFLLSLPFAAAAWILWGDIRVTERLHGLAVDACLAIRGERA